MNFNLVQIYFGGAPSPMRRGCMASAQDAYEGIATYSLYCDDLIGQVIDLIKSDLHIDDTPMEWDASTIHGRVILVEWFRWWWLSKTPNGIYIDTDILVLKPFMDFQGEKPYVAEKDGGMDNCYLACNNRPEWFRAGLEQCVKENHFGMLHHLVKDAEVDLIPESTFIHFGKQSLCPPSERLDHWWAHPKGE